MATHNLSGNRNLTEEQFLDSGIVVGNSLEFEVQDALNKKRAREQPRTSQDGKAQSGGAKRATSGTKRVAPLIDIAGDDERSPQAELHKNMSTFSSLQNYYRYHDALPLTETMKGALLDDQPLSLDDKLQRAGFASLG